MAGTVTLDDIERARSVIADVVQHTPIVSAATFSEWTRCRVRLKAENLQRTGSFKLRGATNRLAALSAEERTRGVCTGSAGNHAQGLALAARTLGIDACVYMPLASSIAKQQATQSYGATVVLEGTTFDEAQAAAQADGRTFVPAFDDQAIIAGQGTIGLELLEDTPSVDTVVVPLGGGGLLSGIATAIKATRPDIRVIGVQAEGCSSYRRSIAAGTPTTAASAVTIADGIAVKLPGEITLPIVAALVDEVVEVSEVEICQAIVALLERSKLVVEGGGAVSLAAVLSGKVVGDDVVCVLSGGNIDATLLQSVLRFGLDANGRFLKFHTSMPDKPGSLARVLSTLADNRVNVLDVEHHREAMRLGVSDVACVVTVETRGPEHAEEILELIRGIGYPATRA